MIRSHIKRDRARKDIIESFLYLHNDNPAAAERFLVAIEETIIEIIEMPHIGAKRNPRKRSLEGLRARRIRGFSNWIAFYVAKDELIDIVRVLHGARDSEQIFAEEE